MRETDRKTDRQRQTDGQRWTDRHTEIERQKKKNERRTIETKTG